MTKEKGVWNLTVDAQRDRSLPLSPWKVTGVEPGHNRIEGPTGAWSPLTEGEAEIDPFGAEPKDSWPLITNVLFVDAVSS